MGRIFYQKWKSVSKASESTIQLQRYIAGHIWENSDGVCSLHVDTQECNRLMLVPSLASHNRDCTTHSRSWVYILESVSISMQGLEVVNLALCQNSRRQTESTLRRFFSLPLPSHTQSVVEIVSIKITETRSFI